VSIDEETNKLILYRPFLIIKIMDSFKNKKVTIGLVLPYLNSRGPDRQALNLAKSFVAKGAKVVLFVVQGWGLDSMYQAFKEVGVTVVNMRNSNVIKGKVIKTSSFLPLAILARKYGCDVLLSRAGRTNRICGLAGLMTFIPTILVLVIAFPHLRSARQLNESCFKRLIYSFRFLKKYAFFRQTIFKLHFMKNFGMPRFVVSVSRETLDNFAASYPFMSNRIITIPNGVEISVEELNTENHVDLDRQKFNICFSGSMEMARKGIDLLLEALRLLIFEFGRRNVYLTLIGTGKDEAKIKALVQEYGLIDNVMFAGEQRNPYPIIKQCDVFVLPSRWEGLPNALLEAMSLGVCCIAADCNTGPREIIENDYDGILVPVDDSRALAHAIANMESEPCRRKELADNGLKTVIDKFSYQKMADAYYELIMRIVQC